MNANTIFLIIQLLIFFLLISCLFVGDTYLTYMIFNASAYTCESFNNITTTVDTTTAATTVSTTTQAPSTTVPSTTQAPSTTVPSTTQAPTTTVPSTTQTPTTTLPRTTALPTKSISQYSSCYKLSDAQVGFARFKIIMFWVLFLCVTVVLIYNLAKLYPQNQILFGIIIAITLIMSIFIIVGGAFMTQYGFLGDNKTCIMPTANASAPQIKSSEYCYNLNQTELNFAKIAVVFGWMYSFAAIITIGVFIWEKNLG